MCPLSSPCVSTEARSIAARFADGPVIYALGSLTTIFSFLIIGTFLATVRITQKRRARFGSDAGKGV